MKTVLPDQCKYVGETFACSTCPCGIYMTAFHPKPGSLIAELDTEDQARIRNAATLLDERGMWMAAGHLRDILKKAES